MKHTLFDTYDTEYVDLPDYPVVKYIVAHPLKTVYINMSGDRDGVTVTYRTPEDLEALETLLAQ